VQLKNNHILVFIKYPQKDTVKTRLSELLDEEYTVELYRNFVMDTLDTLKKVKSCVWICYWPQDYKAEFTDWLGNGYKYMPQTGDDLGERLSNCFKKVFSLGAKHALVIGSDSPDISKSAISNAFSSLETNDIVIGPTFDGGYYLLGFRNDSFLPIAFKSIPWSGNSVFKKTMAIIKSSGKKYFILEKWHDIDTVEDISRLLLRNASGSFSKSRSVKYLKAGIKFRCNNETSI
jgi:hypothetical protein